jgi:hypothetical protein
MMNSNSPEKLTANALRKKRHSKAVSISARSPQSKIVTKAKAGNTSNPNTYQFSIICLYPSIESGKLGRAWIESAFRETTPHASTRVEYYNYAVLGQDSINWSHVTNRVRPNVILMISDGKNQLIPGFRRSLKDLIIHSSNGNKPLVIFRNLEPQPTLNTSVLLDYVSALTDKNHCELNAMDGNGSSLGCFRHPRHLLKARTYCE